MALERWKCARDGTEKGFGSRLGIARVHPAACMARNGVGDVGRNAGLVHHGNERGSQGMEAGASVALPQDAASAECRAEHP